MTIRLALTLFALSGAPLLAQEPELPPSQAPAPVSLADMMAAIEKLRGTYDLADLRLREAVELPAPLPDDRERGLAAASAALAELVKDMDALLEILPESESKPPPSSGGNSSGQKQQNPESGGAQRPENPDGHQPGGQQEQQQGVAPPPTGPPLFGQPPADYGRWGLLPPRLQEALQNSAGTEVPSRYRRWLEEYHRRGQRPR